jgi:hypothetical protein
MVTAWLVGQLTRRALHSGHGVRIGLEDVTQLPDGTPARDSADLVAAALRLIRMHVSSYVCETRQADDREFSSEDASGTCPASMGLFLLRLSDVSWDVTLCIKVATVALLCKEPADGKKNRPNYRI